MHKRSVNYQTIIQYRQTRNQQHDITRIAAYLASMFSNNVYVCYILLMRF